MVRQTLNILQQRLQDFKSVSDHFGTLCIKGLTMTGKTSTNGMTLPQQNGYSSIKTQQ